jgi:uncharacterized protein (TIGR00725 family)
MSPSRSLRSVAIAVCGGQHPNEDVLPLAEAVGEGIARAGALLVCGGLGGVMEAACKGAKRAGGTTVGIVPGLDPSEANPWVDIVIATGIGHARNLAVVASADAVIAVDGEFGTLSEIAFALRLQRPVIGLATWSLRPGPYFGEKGAGPERPTTEGETRDAAVPLLQTAHSPEEAVELAISSVRSRKK